jgi:hypothetical protein
MQRVKESFDGLGSHYVGVVERMPGMTKVELVEEGDDFVTIRTNEGLMRRTNVSKRFEAERVVVEFDEKYQAGSRVTTTSHFLDEFTSGDGGVTLRTVVSDVEAPGFLGFLYRRFGSSKMGKAFLNSHKAYLES